jgi:hypothetical protein
VSNFHLSVYDSKYVYNLKNLLVIYDKTASDSKINFGDEGKFELTGNECIYEASA